MYKSIASYVSCRTGVYYYTKCIPCDVRQHYASETLSFSLRIKSNPGALRAAQPVTQRLEDYWLGLRLQDMDIPAIQLMKTIHVDDSSPVMLDAVENLQEVHKKIMKTNEEIIKFNSEIINLSTQLLADENLDSNYNLDSEAMNIELDSLEKQCVKSKRDCQKLTKKVDVVFSQNLESQQTILNKRQKIMKNRKNISETRKQINLFL